MNKKTKSSQGVGTSVCVSLGDKGKINVHVFHPRVTVSLFVSKQKQRLKR